MNSRNSCSTSGSVRLGQSPPPALGSQHPPEPGWGSGLGLPGHFSANVPGEWGADSTSTLLAPAPNIVHITPFCYICPYISLFAIWWCWRDLLQECLAPLAAQEWRQCLGGGMGMNLLSFSHNFFPSHHFFFFSHWSTVATEKKNQSLSKKVFFCKHFSPAAAHNYYLLLYRNVFSHICERHISVGDKICTPCHLLPSCPLLHCNEHEIRRMWGSHTLRNGPSSSKVVAVVEASPLSLLGTTGQGCLWQQGKARQEAHHPA